MEIANSMYDVVFKHLMSDSRAAKVILGALLNCTVEELSYDRNEYTSLSRDDVHLFRLDFDATISKVIDGKTVRQVVHVELQKAYEPHEIARFTSYLGSLMRDNGKKAMQEGTHPLHIISIYILGHNLEGIDEPVFYVNRTCVAQDGTVIQKGLPNVFIESLSVDMVVVQVSKLQGRARTHLEKMLKIFGGRNIDGKYTHSIYLDEDRDDTDYSYVLGQLNKLLANDEMRRKMDLEDEANIYMSTMENNAKELEKTKSQLSSAVKALLATGQSEEQIAIILNTDIEKIREMK